MRRIPMLAITAVTLALAAPAALAATSARANPNVNPAAGSPPALAALLQSQRAQLTAADGAAGDNFGYSVAISGDTAVVGAPYHVVGGAKRGCAYVFTRTGSTWAQQAMLTAGNGADGDRFGCSVAISGDSVVVGANQHDTGVGAEDQGAAYVFVRSGSSWSEQQSLLASDGAKGDGFGCSVAISGDSLVVGANQRDNGAAADQGAAYVFVRSSGSWSEQERLLATDGAANDRFGWGAAIAGDTVLIGANRHNAEQGCAYLFERGGSTWSQRQQLSATDGAAGDRFGYAVALTADSALVAAPYDDGQRGSAYVFAQSGASFIQQGKLTAADSAANDRFGWSVALLGRVALVGAYWHDVGSSDNQGAAYVYLKSGAGWSQHERLTASDGAANDYFGCAVAVSDETLLVGAYQNGAGAKADQGSAYVFPPDGVPPTTTATVAPPPFANGWSAVPLTVTLQATDAFSGVASTGYRASGVTAWTTYAGPFVVGKTGTSTWEYRSTDLAGNVESTRTLTVKIDTTPPTTSASLKPSANRYGWRNKAVTLKVTVKDSLSGPGYVQYRLVGTQTWTKSSGTVKVTRQGESTYEYRAYDTVGNLSAIKTASMKIDSRRPTTRAFAATVRKGSLVSLRYRVADALPGSGKSQATLRVMKGGKVVRSITGGMGKSNVTRTCPWRCRLTPGRYTVKVYATDMAGNAQVKAGSARITVKR